MVLQSQEMMSVYIGRNLAETLIRDLYKIIHRVLREDWIGPIMVRRADRAEQVQPSDWPERTGVKLTAGMSPAQRNRKAANLQNVLQTQLGPVTTGAATGDPRHVTRGHARLGIGQ